MKRLDHYWYSQNPVAWLLLPVALLFCVLTFIRRYLYRAGFIKSYRANKPVVVVGNISVGGTGKTPLIIKLAELLQQWGYQPGIISRGYGGSGPWPQSLGPNSEADAVGDEPLQIYQRSQCPVVVGPDRVDDIEFLCQRHDIDIILTDDGLQHYRLQRDLELVVVDAERGFGNGFCLPAGPLREPRSRLKAVPFVIYNGGNQHDAFQVRLQPPMNLKTTEQKDWSELTNKKVHAVAGIGHPQRFFNSLKQQGLDIIEHAFADHYQYRPEDLMFDDDLPVLMTEKDSVKCHGLAQSNIWVVPIEIELNPTLVVELKKAISEIING